MLLDLNFDPFFQAKQTIAEHRAYRRNTNLRLIFQFLSNFFNLFQKLELEKKKKEELNEVLFFPDMKTYAGDSNLSRQIKGQLYKEILDHSEPLLRLVEHISSAQVSLDLCLYILTCHKLTEAVISRMREADVRVRLIVHEAKVSGSMVSELQRLGAFVRSVNSDYLMHHKVIFINHMDINVRIFSK